MIDTSELTPDERAYTAYASEVAVAGLNDQQATTQEKEVKKRIQNVLKKKELKLVLSTKIKIKPVQGGIAIQKRCNQKTIKTKRGKLLCAARMLLGVRAAMEIKKDVSKKEMLIAEIYKLHRETAVKVGKMCAEAGKIVEEYV